MKMRRPVISPVDIDGDSEELAELWQIISSGRNKIGYSERIISAPASDERDDARFGRRDRGY
jgi:hypothetical protein